MAYNVLGINPGHNGSVALVSDGKLVHYIEEERLTRYKYDGNPFKAMVEIMKKYPIDLLVIGGTGDTKINLPWTGENPFAALVRKYNPKLENVIDMSYEHHLGHVYCSFVNSGFDESIVIVADGAGSLKEEKIGEKEHEKISGYESESIWYCKKGEHPKLIKKIYSNNYGNYIDTGTFQFDSSVTVTKAYEAVTDFLGFHFIEAGKTMGLASYGKKDNRLPKLFFNNRADKNIFIPSYPAGAFLNLNLLGFLAEAKEKSKGWEKNPELVSELQKNLAWQIQDESQDVISQYIEFATSITGVKNVCISGGYGLNCVANYHFIKKFPELNFYCEPISHDGGTAIGLAYLGYLEKNNFEVNIEPQKSIYYGTVYAEDENKKILNDNVDKIETKKVSYQDVAQLISERNIVSIFQGGSEAGPRALGNRSILYDPRDNDGKDFVNKVKGREWFRPFAGSCLVEDADDWFDMAGLKESPFMMYAVNVAADKVAQIPCITHVDGTCRIQTVNEEQNKHYYNLIKEFKKITGVPILFNTSFNLAGEPLVETLNDALHTLYNSKMKYLYLPELELLVTKTIEDPKEKNESEEEEKSKTHEEFED